MCEKGDIFTSTFAVNPSNRPDGPSKKTACTTLTAVTNTLAEKMLNSNFRMCRGILMPQSNRSGTNIKIPSEIKSAAQANIRYGQSKHPVEVKFTH